MPNLSESVSASLIYSFRDYCQKVNTLALPLNQEQFWDKPYAYGNSFGHLVLHLSGNLNHFIGANIAGTGYIRNKELEFTNPSCHPKEETLQRLTEAIEMVVKTLEQQDESSLTEPYSLDGTEDNFTRVGIFLGTLAHFNHHLGQMIYIANEFSVTKKSVTN